LQSYDLSSEDDEYKPNEVEKELQKYHKGIRAFKGQVAVNDLMGGEHLLTIENTLT
jgi:hypothetical protein